MLAAAGLGSRRACEQLIEEGRVEVDGKVVLVQGMRVDPQKAVIKVDGLRIASAPDHVYLVLNKPKGVVSTMSDPEGRPSLQEYVGDREARLFHVGRLDPDTEGLHPAHQRRRPRAPAVAPVVRRGEDLPRRGAPVRSPATSASGSRQGVELEDGLVQVDSFRLVSHVGGAGDGRGRRCTRAASTSCAGCSTEVGHPVTQLVRTDLGPISLGNLKPGKQRKLSQQEIGALYRAVGL